MSILDDTKEITKEYLEENGWEETSYIPLMNWKDMPSTASESNFGYGFVNKVWKKDIVWRRDMPYRDMIFKIIYQPRQKIVFSVSTIQTHITTINDAHDMNAFIQTMKDVWIPQYFEMFESDNF